ncbi:hypothetical protein [Streptomyces dysideae]|uniref:Uncharacterized protein n=1 Tax=Streptomyces dysideae TaxID=909626 RepID=A0A117RYD0_9ACTN|nr:hypothetical protein [Streptomyces dysideae]KUO16342.1 hypothetical protein AQJ91_36425 [Streptomyces dysideae]
MRDIRSTLSHLRKRPAGHAAGDRCDRPPDADQLECGPVLGALPGSFAALWGLGALTVSAVGAGTLLSGSLDRPPTRE